MNIKRQINNVRSKARRLIDKHKFHTRMKVHYLNLNFGDAIKTYNIKSMIYYYFNR